MCLSLDIKFPVDILNIPTGNLKIKIQFGWLIILKTNHNTQKNTKQHDAMSLYRPSRWTLLSSIWSPSSDFRRLALIRPGKITCRKSETRLRFIRRFSSLRTQSGDKLSDVTRDRRNRGKKCEGHERRCSVSQCLEAQQLSTAASGGDRVSLPWQRLSLQVFVDFIGSYLRLSQFELRWNLFFFF